jgi:hypothetical protein
VPWVTGLILEGSPLHLRGWHLRTSAPKNACESDVGIGEGMVKGDGWWAVRHGTTPNVGPRVRRHNVGPIVKSRIVKSKSPYKIRFRYTYAAWELNPSPVQIPAQLCLLWRNDSFPIIPGFEYTNLAAFIEAQPRILVLCSHWTDKAHILRQNDSWLTPGPLLCCKLCSRGRRWQG